MTHSHPSKSTCNIKFFFFKMKERQRHRQQQKALVAKLMPQPILKQQLMLWVKAVTRCRKMEATKRRMGLTRLMEIISHVGRRIRCSSRQRTLPSQRTLNYGELSRTMSGKLLFLNVLRSFRIGHLNTQHLCGISVLEVKRDHLPMIYCIVASQTTR